MRKKAERLAGCLVVILFTGLIVCWLMQVTERKDSKNKYADFYEQEADFDVVFFGTSHMINGVYPMELWDEYGMVSYNCGGHGNEIATSYWVMKSILEDTTPRLVVIDGQMLGSDLKVNANPQLAHLSLDGLPLSQNKCEALEDLFGESGNKEEFLMGFSIYHNRWNELTEADFVPEKTVEKGAELRIAVTEPEKFPQIGKEEKVETETTGIRYLKKMIEECRARDIEVLLTYLPFPADESYQKEANTLGDIAKQYNVNYINFLEMENLIEWEIDCYDAQSHLNPSGAGKVTTYLGKYIMEHYDIPEQKENPVYTAWEDDYKAYMEYKAKCLREQENLEVYLMLLKDKNLDSEILLRGDAALLKDNRVQSLLENLQIDLEKIPEEQCTRICITAGGSQVSYEHEKLSELKNADIKIYVQNHRLSTEIEEAEFKWEKVSVSEKKQ